MAVNLLPVVNSGPFIDSNGNPLSGGKIYAYVAGSSTPADTYTTSAGSVANANPIILDSGGYPATGGSVVEVWGTSGVSYKLTLKTSADVTVWTRDNISGINDVSSTASEWTSGPAPTYISATSFSLVGDQTAEFQVGRRLKTTNTAGTIYSTISAIAYGAVTTVTVVNDSGTLDSGLSAVSYGLLSPTNPSTPLLADTYPIVSGSADKTKKLRIEVDGFTTATTRVLTPPDADLTLAAVTAAGDILQASASGVLARLGIGTARQVPTVNAGATALAYANPITLGTLVPSSGQTAIDYTGIPSAVRRITIMFNELSLSGTDSFIVQIGGASGIVTSGYVSTNITCADANTVAASSSTAGFLIGVGTAAQTFTGIMVLNLVDAATFLWVATFTGKRTTTVGVFGGGDLALSEELTQVRITRTGTNTIDSGSINISYE